MIQIKHADISPNRERIGTVVVKYHDLCMLCEICLYKDMHLWIRMPEIRFSEKVLKRYIHWDEKQKSDEFQKNILDKVCELLGLTVESAVQIGQDYREKMRKAKKTEK